MNFSKYVKGNRLVLSDITVNITQLISFLQENKSFTQLFLDNCNVGKEGAEALANSENLKSLTTLNLEWTHISDKDAKALLKSDNFPSLKFITLHLGKKVDILQERENSQALSKAVIMGSICGVIAALAVGGGCFATGVALPILVIIGIAVAASILTGLVAGGITYSVSKLNSKLNEPGSETANQPVPERTF